MASLKKLSKLVSVKKSLSLFENSTLRLLQSVIPYQGPYTDNKLQLPSVEIAIPLADLKVDDQILELNGIFGLKCSICKVTFEHSNLLRDHCKLDWHRFNAKQKLLARPPVNEDEFLQQISGELSSISGSDSDDDEDLDPFSTRKQSENLDDDGRIDSISDNINQFFTKNQFKKFYIADNGNLISLYRNTAETNEKENVNGEENILEFGNTLWIYLMLSSGHFAGVVLEKNKVLAHKTFHRYTVRAKRGTEQSIHDKKQGGAKSAGASIRRYNEAALTQEVQDLITSWSEYFKRADKIFYKCSNYHLHVLFDNKNVFKKDDPRCLKISINTRRPTLNEVKRIHNLYSTVENYGPYIEIEQAILNLFPLQDCTTNDDIVDTFNETASKNVDSNELSSNIFEGTPDVELEEVSTSGNTSTSSKKHKNKKIKVDKSKIEKDDNTIINENKEGYKETSNVDILWQSLYKKCRGNDITGMTNFLSTEDKQEATGDVKIDNTLDSPNVTNLKELLVTRMNFFENNYLNYLSQSVGETLLHAAVRCSSKELISLLLLHGCDPAIKDGAGKRPYDIATDKDIRNEFRRFMAKYPTKYDYKNANIPSALTEEQENEALRKNADKKKAQSKARKERLKVKKAEERKEKLEEKEKNTFRNLSDREKRAAMAERRFAEQLSTTLRCSKCRKAILEKDAFERYEFKYCSTDCVQQHKLLIGK